MVEREQQVYVVSVEVRPLEGSAMWGKAAGGFAYCYTSALDARDAVDKVVEALEQDSYELVATEWVTPSSDMAWEEEEQQQKQYASQAAGSDDVVYSAFNTYESKDEH